MAMKILVAVKQVVALDDDFEFRADGKDVDEDFFLYDLNEWDDFSLEEAMKIKEASDQEVEVVVVSIGPIADVEQYDALVAHLRSMGIADSHLVTE
jgi:electron transfer flavoprotein alpha/beta subunit